MGIEKPMNEIAARLEVAASEIRPV